MPQAINQLRWTIDDLEGLPENSNRYEIIDGELHVTRAPHWKHQSVAGRVHSKLLIWSEESGLGESVMTPGVIFSDSDAVIPDVVWVSSERLDALLDEAGHLVGSPDLVIEVLSTSKKDKDRDRKTKLKLYSAQGVLEYWIFDRENQTIEIYRRDSGVLTLRMTLYAEDTLSSPLLPGFTCAVDNLFG
ncbi:MAG: Uma2 family endonuclease [Cyanobacteria bacterium P01_D01_bin.44]